MKENKHSLSSRIMIKSISQARKDIEDWKTARALAKRADDPLQYRLQDLYDEVAEDALLSAQIANREEPTLAAPFELVTDDGTVDDNATAQLRSLPFMQDLVKAILDSELYGFSLVELGTDGGKPTLTSILRRNVEPRDGRFYPDSSGGAFVAYRETREYGRWILEFNAGHIGLLNKVCPHMLFKKFATSCWSELCEIYGIPPRIIKTNTQDPQMLNRAEAIARDMGAAASMVLDVNEDFAFAQGVATNGDVYGNLIERCNSEMSLAITGAILGQDTEHGNYSKEKASMQLLDQLIASDRRMVEAYMNNAVLPALEFHGWVKAAGLRFRFSASENDTLTWQRVTEILPYKDVDNKWIEEKFGIPVSDKAQGDFGGLEARIRAKLEERENGFFG